MLNKNKKLITLLCFILIMFVGGISYAFFRATISGDTPSSTLIQTGTLRLSYDEELIGGEINFPGESTSKIFTVENTGNVATPYMVFFSELTNDFASNNELVYTVSCLSYIAGTENIYGTCDGVSETPVPHAAGEMLTGTTIYPGVIHKYLLTIKFKEMGSNQNYNQGKVFATRITINELVTEVTITGYAFDSEGHPLVNKIIEIHSDPKSALTDADGHYEIPNVKVGDHTLFVKDGSSIMSESPITIRVASKDTIAGSTVEVNSKATEVPLNLSVTAQTIQYNFDTSKTSLKNLIYSYYGTPATFVAKGTPSFSTTPSTDMGLYSASDQDGTAYYFRGAVTHNYVSFAGLTWRILRINGDGTVRMILGSYAKKGDGTTYNVSTNTASACATPANQSTAAECIKYGFGTYGATSIKNYIDEWYTNAISSVYNKYIVASKFCNDYSYGTQIIFGPWYRTYTTKTPNLTCTVPTVAAPNDYKNGAATTLSLSVGMISADELLMAGNTWGTKVSTNLVFAGNSYASTMSGAQYSTYAYIFSTGEIMLNSAIGSSNRYLRPVINLASTVTASGTGTSADPYIIKGM